MSKKLYRSRRDKMLAGVCGGIADYFSIDPTIVRLIWVAGTVFGVGSGIVVYIICAIIIPERSHGYYYDEDDMEVYDKDGNKIDAEFKKKQDNF